MLHRRDANGLAVPRLALDGKRNAAAFGRALGLIAITFHCQGKHRLVTPGCSSQRSPTGHLNRGIDGVFEIVRVIGRGLVSIAEVHAILARAHLAQSEPETARDRFGFLKCHGASTPLDARSFADPRFLVSSRLVRDLLLCAKHWLVAATGGGGHDEKEGPRPEGDGARPARAVSRADRKRRTQSSPLCLIV